MGRQFRNPRRGTGGANVQPSVIPTTANLTIAIPNYGLTDLSTYAAGEYVMDAPEFGLRKTLIRSATASSGVIVRFATDKSVSAGTLGTTAGTQVTFDSTLDCCIVLIGQSATHWVVESMWSSTANTPLANSTGIYIKGT